MFGCPLAPQHIAKQATGLDRGFLAECVNVILLRNPLDILCSVRPRVHGSS